MVRGQYIETRERALIWPLEWYLTNGKVEYINYDGDQVRYRKSNNVFDLVISCYPLDPEYVENWCLQNIPFRRRYDDLYNFRRVERATLHGMTRLVDALRQAGYRTKEDVCSPLRQALDRQMPPNHTSTRSAFKEIPGCAPMES